MKWRVAVVYTINADNEQDAYEKADALVAGDDSIDAEYGGVWTMRPDTTDPLGPLD